MKQGIWNAQQRERLSAWWARRGWRLARFVVAAMAMSCSGDTQTGPILTPAPSGPGDIAHVRVAIDTATMARDSVLTINSSVTNSSGNTVPAHLAWLTRDGSVARVDAMGSVTAVGVGSTRIVLTATAATGSSSGSDSLAVTVVGRVAAGSGGERLSGMQLIGDDFREYASQANLLDSVAGRGNNGATGDPGNTLYDADSLSNINLDASMKYNNHSTLRMTRQAGSAWVPGMWVAFGAHITTSVTGVTSFWAREKIRWGAGYVTQNSNGALPKFSCARMGNMAPPYINACDLVGWLWFGSDTRGTVTLGPISAFYDASIVANAAAPSGSLPAMSPDTWYDLIIYFQQTSATTYRERAWIAPDGSAPVLVGDASSTYNLDQLPTIRFINLGMNQDPSSPTGTSQTFWIGQWEVVNGAAHSDPYGIITGTAQNQLKLQGVLAPYRIPQPLPVPRLPTPRPVRQ